MERPNICLPSAKYLWVCGKNIRSNLARQLVQQSRHVLLLSFLSRLGLKENTANTGGGEDKNVELYIWRMIIFFGINGIELLILVVCFRQFFCVYIFKKLFAVLLCL